MPRIYHVFDLSSDQQTREGFNYSPVIAESALQAVIMAFTRRHPGAPVPTPMEGRISVSVGDFATYRDNIPLKDIVHMMLKHPRKDV